MRLVLPPLIAPAARPIDIAEARAHVGQDLAIDDALLARNIAAARDFAEGECHRTIIATRHRMVGDRFPCGAIALERGPVLAVRSVKYLDMAGVLQTMSAADYVVDTSGVIACIAPVFGKTWPSDALPQLGSVRVEFDAGEAAALSVSIDTNTLTIRGGIWAPLVVGDSMRLSNSGGALPAPLQPDTDYFVQSLPTATSFTLAATEGGPAIDLTDTGSGTHFIGAVPDGLVAWMLLRLAGLYENRQDAAVVERGAMQALPYVDRLLDPYRIEGA